MELKGDMMTPEDKTKLREANKIREANSRGETAKPKLEMPEILASGNRVGGNYRHWSWMLRRFWK